MTTNAKTLRLVQTSSSYRELYERCRSETELLEALGHAVGTSAAELAESLRPTGALRRLAIAGLRMVAPGRYEEHWLVQRRVFSESVVFIGRQLRDLFERSYGLGEHAEYVYREAMRGAGCSLAAQVGMTQERAQDFERELSHVVLQHAHFPPRNDDEALVRLVSARGKKLTLHEAVSFLKTLVGDDPLRRTEPWAFVRRWLTLRGEPAWRVAAASA